jgi:hypothetical protein
MKRIISLVMLFLFIPVVCFGATATEKSVQEDRVSASTAVQKVNGPNPELEKASAELNKDQKKYKALVGAGVATAAVAAIYVGGHNWSDLQNKVGVDRVAHFGVSYIICDQLQAAGMNQFWATTTTIAIGAAKEKWVDNKWDGGDFAADCAGALMANIRF